MHFNFFNVTVRLCNNYLKLIRQEKNYIYCYLISLLLMNIIYTYIYMHQLTYSYKIYFKFKVINDNLYVLNKMLEFLRLK